MRRVFYFRDFVCASGHKTHTFVESTVKGIQCPNCFDVAVRPEVMTAFSAAVHGDELDYVDHNLGREPVHIRSKSQRRALMAAGGLEEFIRHTPVPGTDKSPYTTDWSKGSMDPQTLANAKALVDRVYGGVVPAKPEDEVYAPVANPFVFTATPEEVRDLIEDVDG